MVAINCSESIYYRNYPFSFRFIFQAMAEKELGNAAYKQKKFDVAISHYDKAIELDPKEMSFLNNKAAVFFEQKVK